MKGTTILVFQDHDKSTHFERGKKKDEEIEAPSQKEEWVHKQKNTQHGPPYSELVNSV